MKINYFSVPGIIEDKFTANDLNQVIADYYGFPVEVMSSRSRKGEYVEARQIAFYWLNVHFGYSLAEAGMFLGGRDHATGSYSIQMVDTQYAIDGKLKTTFDFIRDNVEHKIKRIRPYNGRGEVILKNLPYASNITKK